MEICLTSWSYILSLHLGIIATAYIKKDQCQRISPFLPSFAYLVILHIIVFIVTLLSFILNSHT